MTTGTEMLTILGRSRLFKNLSEVDLSLISAYGKKKTFNKNDMLIREGQSDHSLFIIISGQVEVILPKRVNGLPVERATRIKLGKMVHGDFIGEYSFIDKEPASASVLAIEPCEVFEITKPDFEKIINSSDRLAKTVYKNILQVVIKRIRDINKELDMCF
ncbi:MAG: cyclic nucleotide-binding domain-containing protein [Pseudomonadota bacterium]